MKSTPGNRPRASIDHTAVDAPGRTNLYGYFARADVGAESTGWIFRNGDAEQFMSCDVVANANRKADTFANSWETEDDGDPERWEWTDAQLEKLAQIHTWEALTFGIPAHASLGPLLPQAAGFGYHAMWRTMQGGNPWTSFQGKTCPGSKRIQQWWSELLPEIQQRVAAGRPQGPQEWSDMASKAEIEAAIAAQMKPILELVGVVKAQQSRFEEDTRILLEGTTVRLPDDPRQFVLTYDDGQLVAVHVKDQAQLDLLKQAREVGPNELWNQVTVTGAAADALRALVG